MRCADPDELHDPRGVALALQLLLKDLNLPHVVPRRTPRVGRGDLRRHRAGGGAAGSLLFVQVENDVPRCARLRQGIADVRGVRRLGAHGGDREREGEADGGR